MKQIFDWLREQMQVRIDLYNTLDTTETAVDVAIKETERFIEYINEAEAKWEAECCEWSPMKYLEFSLSDCVTSCGHAEHYSTGIDKYCRHCGKPIKISEVE